MQELYSPLELIALSKVYCYPMLFEQWSLKTIEPLVFLHPHLLASQIVLNEFVQLKKLPNSFLYLLLHLNNQLKCILAIQHVLTVFYARQSHPTGFQL